MPVCDRCHIDINSINNKHQVACAATPPPAELARRYLDAGQPAVYRFAEQYGVSRKFMVARLEVGLARINEPDILNGSGFGHAPVTPPDAARCDRCTLLIHSDRELDIGLCHYCIEEVGIAWQS